MGDNSNQNSGNGTSGKIIIGAVASGLVTLTTILANVTQIFDNTKRQPAETASVETAAVETTVSETASVQNAEVKLPETAPETETAVPETESETAPTKSETQTPETETAPSETIPVQDEIKADSTFHVTNLAAIPQPPAPYDKGWYEYSGEPQPNEFVSEYDKDFASVWMWENVSFFDYDPFSDTLYYMPTPHSIKSRSMKTGEEKLLADISDEIKLISVNPKTGTLYAVIDGSLYDVTHDAWAVGDASTMYYFPSDANYENIYFSAEDTAAEINTASYSISTISLTAKDFIQRNLPLRQIFSGVVYAYPFLSQDCYYWFGAAAEKRSAAVVRTVQLLPSGEANTAMPVSDFKNIVSFCVGSDGLYYYDAQKNIYQFDVSAEHGSSTLLKNAENPDILLMSGANLQNTATSYLSGQIGRFIKISSSRFVFYDMSDNMLKLIEAD